ncbi:MAG: outer membrane protein assembly factor BamE [Methylococcaceae bacterium]|nr:outer membrane protein assembly factor BamE [Methylococcaceae bacterium]MCI0667088.1 outer membrane protein assembly factor BamE [Methylococcaceae bacterium]MCI0733853.1 outer membrane protein assembly factor BamE [Methylococcaceae bacterium]
MSKHLIFIPAIASFISISCVYQVDVEQGNIVTPEMVDLLEPNMNKRQVRYVLGTPLVVDVFHQDRWDYIYSLQPGGEAREQKRISVVFENDRLVGLQGDFRPSNEPPDDTPKDTTVNVPRLERDKTLWEMITGLFIFDEE